MKTLENQFIVDWKILTSEELNAISKESLKSDEDAILPGTFKGYDPIQETYSDPTQHNYLKL